MEFEHGGNQVSPVGPFLSPVCSGLDVAPPGQARLRRVSGCDFVARVAFVAVQGFDVVSVGVEEVRGVVARAVVAVARGSVRPEAGRDTGGMERVDLRA